MAFVAGTAPLDMRELQTFVDDGDVIHFDSTVIRVRMSDNSVQDYRGSFDIQFDPSVGAYFVADGTITDIYEFYDLNLTVKHGIQHVQLPLAVYESYVTANDANGLLAYILQGDDTFMGVGTGDYLLGYGGNDTFSPLTGAAFADGGVGNDRATFAGARATYDVVRGNGQVTVTSLSGVPTSVTLADVETLQFADQAVTVNNIATINQAGALPRGVTSVAVSGLFSVTDADGDTMTRYRFMDSNAGGARFLLEGFPQVEGASFDVASWQLPDLRLQLGPPGYTNDFWLQAYDGYSWSDWSHFQVISPLNNAPVVSVSNMTPSRGTSVIAAANLFSVADGDGDAITQYKFFDGTTGGGRFRRNGVGQAEQSNITVDAADLGTFDFALGGTSDVLWVQAYDGVSWSAWKNFTVSPPQNNAPVVLTNPNNLNPGKGTATVAASNFFGVTDADGDAITQYRFFDGTAGNGHFELNGTPQTELVNLTVNASDLANFTYRVSSTGAGDTLWVQVFDGTSWSAWHSFNVAAPANAAPAAAVGDRTPARGTTTLAASSLVSATDADGDMITGYKFFDGTAGSGHFRTNGIDQPDGVNFMISAPGLASTEFVLGSGNDVLWVQVSDGVSWSAWKSFTVFAPQNNLPVVSINAGALNPAKGTVAVAASSFFSVTDADSDTITKYRFFDGSAGNGRFELNGTPQTELTNLEVDASDLAKLRYRVSTTGTGDTLWVQAFDGSNWGAWKSFDVSAPQNSAPIISMPFGTVVNPGRNALITPTISAADAENDHIVQFRYFDGTAGNGHFELNGAPLAELQNLTFNTGTADLSNLVFRASTTGVGDVLWVQVFDGYGWSNWLRFEVAPLQNTAPVVTVNQGSLNPGHGTPTIAASNFFSTSDADGDTITQFRFFDGTAGNGRFELNGVAQAELTNITINASDLANFRYHVSGTGAGDTLWVQAFDGMGWSAWQSFNATAPQNAAPVVTIIPGNLSLPKNIGSVGQWSFYTFSDPDGDGIVQYRFFDGTAGNGHFALDGVAQPELQNLTITSADFAKMSYVAGAPGSGDTLWIQLYDGLSWSDWKSFNVTIQSNQTPVVTVSDLHPWLGLSTISAASMFTVSDDDTPVRYRFFDGTVGNGCFQLNGINQVESQNITVEAADLANFRFATSTTGDDVLWVQAYDGTEWSAWKSFTVTAQAGNAPGGGTGGSSITDIDGSTGGVVIGVLQPPPETFFESTSPTGDTYTASSYAPDAIPDDTSVEIGAATRVPVGMPFGPAMATLSQWQFWDATSGGGAFSVDGIVQAANQVIDVMVDQMEALRFLAGNAPGTDQLWARAQNDHGWGAWKQFSITTLAPT